MLDFTIGLTEGVAWPWPIAVYLFLAGISGGAVAVAICVNLFRGVHLNTPIMKAASLIGFITIVLGMICLVLDLTNPLFFWRILVYYNPTSVMSIGVMALLFYIPLVFVLMCVSLQQEITSVSWLKWLDPIISFFAKFRVALDWVVLILAIAICAYTGFLIFGFDPLPADQHRCPSGLVRGFRLLRRLRRNKSSSRMALRCRSSRNRSACAACC